MPQEYDEDFYEVIYDEDGGYRVQLRLQISKREQNDSMFTCFDTSHGHCGLCGSLGCNGRCFK